MSCIITDGDDDFTTIGTTGAVILLLITIATIGVVLSIIVYRKKRVKKDPVEHIYDIPVSEPLSTEHVSKCDILLKEIQKEEMHQYDVADSGLLKRDISSEEIQKEDMQYNVAYSGLPNSEIQKEEMQTNMAYGVCHM